MPRKPSKKKPPPKKAAPAPRKRPARRADLRSAPRPALGNIPWGYGQNRVTALARDPRWIFVYWEVTDEALARARADARAPHAGCTLRVYDTTHRLFDGANANRSFDVPVDRAANNHYLCVNAPGSVFHVDIGVKGPGGEFATIARSGAVETPRDSVSPDARVEWMTVAPEPAGPEFRHRFVARPGRSGGGPPPELEYVLRALVGEGWTRAEWSETVMGGRVVRWIRWTRGPRLEMLLRGEVHVAGPWRVTILEILPGGGRRVIDQWVVRYAWGAAGGSLRVETEAILRRIVAGYRVLSATSGSEERWVREAWSSESLALGASEGAWLGASEAVLGGASETLSLESSPLQWRGGSELLGGFSSEEAFR